MATASTDNFTLGTTAPGFNLPDTVSGNMMSLDQLKSDVATVVTFICNHCPYVIHVQSMLVDVATEYQAKGVTFIAISSNDAVTYPDDGPEQMKAAAEQLGYPFPYLYDESQDVARAYNAMCTPDTYVFDGAMTLVYRGQLDDTRPRSGQPATGDDLRAALDAVLAGQPVSEVQKPSIGCSIKWKQ